MIIRKIRKIKYTHLISLPKEVIDKLKLNEGDYVTINVDNNEIIIKKVGE